MTRAIASALAVVLLAGIAACRSRPDNSTLERTNRNLEGTIHSQQRRIDTLVASKTELDQKVKLLEAELEKVRSAETIVGEAKDEISAHLREMLERFRSDSDIAVERTPGGYRFVLREAVLFATGSANLTEEGRAALQRVADALRGTQSKVSIEGHTDDVPVAKPETLKKFPRGNMELSVQRSLAVWDHLIKNGKISASRLSVAGFGQHRPRVPNDSERNRWRNRRVEIRVAEP